MDERNIVHSLVYDRLRINAFSKIHRSLREFGMKAMDFIEEQVHISSEIHQVLGYCVTLII
jgi:hypothetical protein